MQQPLQIFEDEHRNRIRSVTIDGDPWFYGLDVCTALDLGNPSAAFARLDEDEKRTLTTNEGSAKVTRINPLLISESGLYTLILQSRKPEAKAFKRWVTKEVLPQLRKTGQYSIVAGVALPIFVRRFNDNWDRVDTGYFSVLNELFIRLYGRLEHLGHIMPDKGAHGKEMRPDVAVGGRFSKWLSEFHPDHCAIRKNYWHLLRNGNQVEAYQYHRDTLALYLEYVDTVWIPIHAEEYFSDRDPAALAYLPKLLPVNSVPPKAANNLFEKIKQLPKPSEEPALPEPPASEQSAKNHFARMRAALKMRKPPEEPF